MDEALAVTEIVMCAVGEFTIGDLVRSLLRQLAELEDNGWGLRLNRQFGNVGPVAQIALPISETISSVLTGVPSRKDFGVDLPQKVE